MNISMKTLFLISFVTLSVLLVPIRAEIAYAEFSGNVKGWIKFIFYPDGNVNIVAVIVKGLESGKEYPYHIHVNPIKDGNCTSAGGHFDPTVGRNSTTYKCDRNKPDECEVGDLSGKYGGLEPDYNGYVNQYAYDPYIKLEDLKGRSIVIHLPDTARTRYDCTDIIVPYKKRRLNRRLY